MEGPVAVITGAGRGIGRAAAIELAAAGYRVTLISRTREALAETARLAGSGTIIPTDVTRPHEVAAAIQKTVTTHGRLDAVVHCAGIAPLRSIVEMSVEEWREVIDTNLSSAFYLCRAAWPIFQRQHSGVVVNVSSAAARDPFAGFAAYGAAKAGLNLFGLSAAREGKAIGVRVHTIAPAAVETDMFRKILTAEQYPTQNALRPQEVARVIVACVRGELQYTSGEVIHMHKTL